MSLKSTSPNRHEDEPLFFDENPEAVPFFLWAVAVVVSVLIFIGVCIIIVGNARAHEHPPQDAQLHESFYKDLKQPGAPNLGCCDNRDCYPTRAKFDGKQWWAVRREDKKWIAIPPEKINTEKSPDGQAHLCAPAPIFGADLVTILCFVPPDYPGT